MKRTGIVLLIILLAGCAIQEDIHLQGIALEGENEAVILIHGLGATPYEVQELAETIHDAGYAVYAPLLAGHGSTIDELRHSTWEDWYATIKNTHNTIIPLYDDVHVVGVSAGGNLALLLASKEKVNNVVVVAPALYLQDKRTNYALLAKYFVKDIQRNLTPEEQPHYSSVFPVRTIGEWVMLAQETKKKLKYVDEPVLILQSRKDPRVNPKSSAYVYAQVNSKQKQLHYVDDEKHVLIRGKGSEDINKKLF
jgi:carboxylesterase